MGSTGALPDAFEGKLALGKDVELLDKSLDGFVMRIDHNERSAQDTISTLKSEVALANEQLTKVTQLHQEVGCSCAMCQASPVMFAEFPLLQLKLDTSTGSTGHRSRTT